MNDLYAVNPNARNHPSAEKRKEDLPVIFVSHWMADD